MMNEKKTAEDILGESFEPQPLELLRLYSKKNVIKAMQEYAAQETATLREELEQLKWVKDCSNELGKNFAIRIQELKQENERLKEALKAIIPLAEDGHALHKRNGCHQEFLYEDVERIENAKKLI